MMCRKCGRRATHRLRPRPAASSPYMAGEASRRPRSGDVGPAPRRSPGSRGSTPLSGLRHQRLLPRVRRLLARCPAIALHANGMSTQRASICPDSPAPRRGALKRRRGGARRGRPGVRSAVGDGKGGPSPGHGASSGERAGHLRRAPAGVMASRSLRGRHRSRLGHARLEARRRRRQPAGSPDYPETKRGRAVVEAEDERQQDSATVTMTSA
jgi:hypothetical protein